MKLFMALNMHYSLPDLFTRPEITLMLWGGALSTHPDLDQNVMEFTIDFPEDQVITPEDQVDDYSKLEPGLYNFGHRWVYKGDPVKITNTRTVKKARLPVTEDIPRVSIVAVVEREVLAGSDWYYHTDVKAVIERYKPKWGAKGYIFGKIGNDKVRIDYIPITVNPDAVAALIKTVLTFGEQIMAQIPEAIADHGSKQELFDL